MSYRVRILILTAALALAVPTVATATPKSPDDTYEKTEKGVVSTTFRPRVLDGNAKVNVMVELKGDPVAVAEAKADRKLSRSERTGVKQKLRKAQDAISGDIATRGGKVMSRMQSAYNGMRVQIARSKADSLAKLPGVVAVHAITPKTLENSVSVPYLGVPEVWQSTGYTGEGVKVAIIDTGIDYTHADFGGPGTTEAFTEAAANSTTEADPALFGPNAPRIKGGYDFVGDDYDASADADDPAATPKPDPNPLDCNGHGTHVAGTAGGNGVTADGATYAGPYNADTPNTEFKVAPGVAPEVDLYALRVIGCDGSTDVVAEAIDWAVDHDMDVINMSLGAAFGRADDPDTVAATNAVGAGVVVVASAGNNGHNPYLTGAPGVGKGVIAVSAVDSTASFPGAELTFDGQTMAAINANSAELPEGEFEIVQLTDDPSTPENEALGCSAGAFTAAGISADEDAPAQLAVTVRGTCARVARAIFGQQAGADAVVMVNNSAEYPPYEGPITENPDDGTPYEVTIPFLGVRNSDGPALAEAAGSPVTLAAAELDNPNFRGYASLTSGGPANGDSALSPNVAAPGVSISSAGVGTGTGAAVFSGTSMAAPHVAGIAALGVQAHPGWRAQDVAAAVVSTADPNQIPGYSVTLGGLVDAAQTVQTSTFATGDSYRTTSGRGAETSLSFGFAEPRIAFVGTKVLTIHNPGRKAITYTVSSEASAQSRPATLKLSVKKVKVPARGTAKVRVTLTAPAASVGSSLGTDQLAFRQVSGNVVLAATGSELRVPYLLVPRAQAQVKASVANSKAWTTLAAPNRKGAKPPKVGPLDVRLSNPASPLDAAADFFTWGLSDGRDVPRRFGGGGYDLRAAGAQSFDTPDGKLLVFAVNTHDRWSTAASQEFDVSVDTNGDGQPEYVVFSLDAGALAGGLTGLTGVFIFDVATSTVTASGFLAQAPTDSSTILLPVYAADLGLTDEAGDFKYTVDSFTLEDPTASDSFTGWASYNPWARAIADGDYVTVERNRTAKVSVAVDPANYAAQKPKGVMVVVLDNKSGAREALLLGAR